jgi:hypothetical protein
VFDLGLIECALLEKHAGGIQRDAEVFRIPCRGLYFPSFEKYAAHPDHPA